VAATVTGLPAREQAQRLEAAWKAVGKEQLAALDARGLNGGPFAPPPEALWARLPAVLRRMQQVPSGLTLLPLLLTKSWPKPSQAGAEPRRNDSSVWKAATSKADPAQKRDWISKWLQGGRAHALHAPARGATTGAPHRLWV
jgi:hypothetical protein